MDDQEKLFSDNIKLCHYIVNRLKQNAFDHDDMVQIAMIGLWKACKTYNPDKNCKFTSYAYRVIKHELLQSLRSVRCRDYTKDASLDQLYEDTTISYMDTIADDTNVEDIIEIKDTFSRVKDLFKILTGKERVCIELYYLKGYKQKTIAEMYNVSQSEISRTIIKACKKLKNKYISKYGDNHENT